MQQLSAGDLVNWTKQYGLRVPLCFLCAVLAYFDCRSVWEKLPTEKRGIPELLAQASATQQIVCIAAVVLIPIVWLWGPGSIPWRWFWYTRRAPRRSRAFRHRVEVRWSEGSHGLISIWLHRPDPRGGASKREGTISLCAYVSGEGSGIRRSRDTYLFCFSGGHEWDGAPAGKSYTVSVFALARAEWDNKPCWAFKAGPRHYDRPDHETWAKAVDDLQEGWHHFVCAWRKAVGVDDRDLMCLYIDGVRRADESGSAGHVRYPDAKGELPLLIGAWTTLDRAYYAEAEMAWAAYYPTMLDDKGVKRLFRLQPWAKPPTP